MKFDELYRLEDYFEPMVLSVDSKAKRRELAELLTDVFLYFFSVFEVHSLYKSMLEQAMYEQLLADKISDAVSKVTGIDSEMSRHIRELSKQVVETTYENVNKAQTQIKQSPLNPSKISGTDSYSALFGDEPLDSPIDVSGGSLPHNQSNDDGLREEDVAKKATEPEDENENEDEDEGDKKQNYWLSFDRASSIAASEANTFFNYNDYVTAKQRGYTKKTWRTMLDPKVRDTHEEIEGQTIGIDEVFYVGDSMMRFPHDWEYEPSAGQVVNCRCSVEYK